MKSILLDEKLVRNLKKSKSINLIVFRHGFVPNFHWQFFSIPTNYTK